MSAGAGNAAYSSVQVDLNLSNLGATQVKGLTSTIFQSTFGFYVAPFSALDPACSGATLPGCGGSTSGTSGFAAMADANRLAADPYSGLFPFAANPAQNPAQGSMAETGFLFSVLVDDVVQDQFGGMLTMRDNGTNPPVISGYSLIDGTLSTDISLLAGRLPGFSLLADTDLALIYGWDQSNFTYIFDTPLSGEGGTVSYRIKTFSFSDVLNLERDSSRSIVSFSCFADPVGRGSTSAASVLTLADPTCDDFTQLGSSAAQDYVLNFGGIDANGNLVLTSAVPEPDSWAMLILGFGLVGLSLRRQGKSRAITA